MIVRRASVDSTDRSRARLAVLLILISLAALAIAASAAFGNQLFLGVAPIRVSIRNPRNPILVAMLAGVLAFRFDRGAAWMRVAGLVDRFAAFATFLVIAAVVAACMRYGASGVGGADSSGYANEARLLRSFSIDRPLPPVTTAVDWPDKDPIFTPLGYQADGRGAMRPTYPPGYPLLMAAAATVAGERAIFAVVPITAAAAIGLVFVIARQMAGRLAGLIAVVLMAVSPIFLFQSFQPMSDVPATFSWLLVFALLLRGTTRGVVWAGVVAGFACLVRPNLLVLAAAAVPLAAWWKPANVSRVGHAIRFAVGLVPGMAFLFAWNTMLYGGPTQTGYGSPDDLLSVANVAPNLERYLSWLISLHGPFVCLGLLAPLALRLIHADDRAVSGRVWQAALSAVAFVVTLLAFYLLYIVFDTWPYLRFLLPGLALLFVLFSVLAVRALAALPLSLRVFAGWLIVVGVVFPSIGAANRLRIFDVGESDGRFEQTARRVTELTPSTAVVFSMLHSGSVTYYADRPIARWDLMLEGSIRRTADDLKRAGHSPYLLIDDLELAQFEDRHGPLAQQFPQLQPVVLVTKPIRVQMFDLSRLPPD